MIASQIATTISDKEFDLLSNLLLVGVSSTLTYFLSRRQSRADLAAKFETLANNAFDRQEKLQAQVDKMEEQNDSMRAYVETMKTANSDLIEEREKLRTELNRIHEELETLRRELAAERERNVMLEQSHRKEMLEKEQRIQGLESIILTYQGKMDDMKKKIQQLERKSSTGELGKTKTQ